MDHEPTDPLNDPTLEREIESLLAVDPSPEFLARVRTRIAQDSPPSPWRWNWGFALIGAAAAVLLAVFVTSWTTSFTPTAVPQQTVSTEDVTLKSAPPQPADGVRLAPGAGSMAGSVPRVRHADAHRQAVQPAISDAPPFAEVLVSADEVRAYELVVGITRQQRLPAPPVEEPVGGALPPVTIEALTIEPLPQIARLETGERP